MKMNQKGQNLIEVILAMALFAIFVSGFSVLGFRYWETTRMAMDIKDVQVIVQEAFDAVTSIEYGDFAALVDGIHGLDDAGSNWALAGGSDLIDGKYTRTVTIAAVNRDGDCNIVPVGGDPDPDTKAVTVEISWDDGSGIRTSSFTRNYTNWSGPVNCTSLPPGVVTILGCAGLTQGDLPVEIINNLIVAEAQGDLDCIEEDMDTNLSIPAGGAALTARNTNLTIDGNINGNDDATLVLGFNSLVNVTGNVNNMGYVAYGDGATQNGNLNNADEVWFLGTATLNGMANIEELTIEADAHAIIANNADFDESLTMGASSIWDIGGKLSCHNSATATIDPTAVVNVGGTNKCDVVP